MKDRNPVSGPSAKLPVQPARRRRPRDQRDDEDWFDVVSDENGVFGCAGLMACHDVCPKDLPLLEVYAYLRRKALATGMSQPRELLQIQT